MTVTPFQWWKRKIPAVEAKQCRTILHPFTGEYEDDGGLTANPYVGCAHRCCYCYATYEWAPEFYDKIIVKENAPRVLEAQLRAWRGKRIAPVFFASATDSYQPQEGVYKLTRKCVQILQKYGVPYYIFTKSGTILRDLDLHAQYEQKCLIVWSITTLDDGLKRLIEPNVTPTKSLLKVIKRFSDNGVRTAVNIDPVIPGLTDDRKMLDDLIRRCVEAGAKYLATGVLRLRDDIWGRMKPLLDSIGRNDVVRLLEALYYSRPILSQGYHLAPKTYRDKTTALIEERAKGYGASYGIPVVNIPALDSPPCANFILQPKERYEDASLLSHIQTIS